MEVLGNLITAIIAALLAFSLSLWQFRSQKWWELKIEAYQKIFKAFHFLKKSLDYDYEAELLHKEKKEEKTAYEKALEERASEGQEEIAMAFDIGIFLLSEDFSKRLKQYQDEVKKAGEHNTYFEYLDHYSFETNNCLKDLIALAKKDLESHQLSWVKRLLNKLQTYYNENFKDARQLAATKNE